MKKIKNIGTLSLVLLLSFCKPVGDKAQCYSIDLDTRIINKELGTDATGDSLDPPYIKYNKDSIRCQVITVYDTTSILIPEIKRDGISYIYRIRYNLRSFDVSQRSGMYKLIFYFNSVEKDSIIVHVKTSRFYDFDIYRNDSLLYNQVTCEVIPQIEIYR